MKLKELLPLMVKNNYINLYECYRIVRDDFEIIENRVLIYSGTASKCPYTLADRDICKIAGNAITLEIRQTVERIIEV